MRKTTDIKNAQAAADLDDGVAVVPRTGTSVAMRMGEVTGEVDEGDVILPKLSIAYGVGDLAAEYNPGDFVLNKEYFLASKSEVLKVIVLGITKFYKEYRTLFDRNAPLPKTWATKKDLQDTQFPTPEGETRGGRMEWSDNPDTSDGRPRIAPDALPASTMVLLIQKPKDLICPTFVSEFNGEHYAPALFYADKNAWVRSAKKVLSASRMETRETGLTSRFWDLYTGNETLGGNITVLPYLRLSDKVPDDLREWVGSRFLGQ